jgi:hypothetical protein
MARSYKSIGKTCSMNRPCLRCFHCKTRVFRSLDEIVDWCKRKDLSFNFAWKKRFNRDKKLSLYWCDVPLDRALHVKPRIFRRSDKPFRIDCKLFDGGDVDGII